MKRTLPLALLSSFALLGILRADPLEVGDEAPALKTVDQHGEEVDLGAAFAEGFTLVYFYPKADTPGCTTQTCNLRDAFEEVTEAGIQVFGVSADSSADQLAFAEKYEVPFTLLADFKGEVIKAFGVPTRGAGLPSRQSFLVKDGKIVWRDLSAKPATQAQDAIAAAKSVESAS